MILTSVRLQILKFTLFDSTCIKMLRGSLDFGEAQRKDDNFTAIVAKSCC